MVVPGQRLDRLCAKIKFLKIRVLLHFAIKNSKLVCKMSRDSVPKNSASITNRVFKKLRVKSRDDYVINPSEVVNVVQGPGLLVKYERAVGASPINSWNMYALRRQTCRPQRTFGRWTPRTHESPRELARQSEAKRKQSPRSEANVCQHKCNLNKTSLINCTGHPIMNRTPNTN